MERNKHFLLDMIFTSLLVSFIITIIGSASMLLINLESGVPYQSFELGVSLFFWITTTYLIGFLFLSPLFFILRSRINTKVKQALIANSIVTILISIVIYIQNMFNPFELFPYLLICPLFTVISNYFVKSKKAVID